MRNRVLFSIILLLPFFTSCRQEDDTIEIVPARHWVEKTVAVVAPVGDAATKTRLERTAEWFLENFREAQLHDTLAIDLKLEWHDELSEDLEALSGQLAGREDIVAVIGPFANGSVARFAPACSKTQKPLITPTATSEDIIRRYAVTTNGLNTNAAPFLWSLTETDVSLAGLLMSSFATMGKHYSDILGTTKAAVFSPDDTYGMTFNYWAPFYALENDIDLQRNDQYRSLQELLQQIADYREAMLGQGLVTSAIFCVAETAQQLYEVARANRQAVLGDPVLSLAFSSTDPDDPANDQYWQVFKSTYNTYFAFSALSEEGLAALGPRAAAILQGYEGFSPYADPTTGFEQSYKTRFGVLPTFAECKFYDALMLAAFATCYAEHQRPVVGDNIADINHAIRTLTIDADGASLSGPAWNATSMEIYLSAMERGHLLHFVGASGEISFDADTYTAATTTTYVHWQLMDGQIIHRGYFGSSGVRTADAKAAWRYLYDQQEASKDFEQQAAGGTAIQYPALADQYAVLVQGSTGFINYRHQADVLSVYQALRRGGFPDDHIILIIDGSIANDPQNPEPGIIRSSLNGPDLLGGHDYLPAAAVDYDSADLTASDVAGILQGVGAPSSNVLLYWSGHGRSNSHGGADEFCWRDTPHGQGFTASMLRETARQMQFRKLLIAAEPCYGECVISAVEGIPGVLAMSGASATEQSWADCWSNDAHVWLCDRFSQNLVTCLTDNPDTSFRDLFLYCATHTLGSHAKIVNAAHFGNLYTTGPSEFIRYHNK